ncbi:MAG: DedA family protein, partial [Syntrophomonadaceae bacterium]|nr:DedA family protein [Syntrophomonadaceae bacterium]
MEAGAFNFVVHYGYWAIALLLAGGIIGIPIPDELLLVFCGYLVYADELHFTSTLIWCFLGSIIGMTISYILGAKVGLPTVNRYLKRFGMKDKYLQKVQSWFQKLGPFTIFIGYYIPGVRQLSAFYAAASKVPYWKFLLFAAPGGLVWVAVFLKAGVCIGYSWDNFLAGYHQYHKLLLALVAVI